VRAVLGYLFLLAFVFLIVVVLMNLLNGLAVSDTAAIERVRFFFTFIYFLPSFVYFYIFFTLTFLR
jgi:hypothetical protein